MHCDEYLLKATAKQEYQVLYNNNNQVLYITVNKLPLRLILYNPSFQIDAQAELGR